MALRVWVFGCVLGSVACSGTTESSDPGGENATSSASSASGGASSAGGGASSASGGASSASGGASTSTGQSGNSQGGSNAGTSANSQGGASAVTSGQGGSQTVGVGGSNGGTSNHDQPDCDVYFDELDRGCQTAEDCTLVQHQTDCCGGILVMGIAATAAPDFSAVEQYCAAQFPLCGCAARGLELEDGTLIDFGSSAYAAECVDGQCRSHSTAPTSACGPQLKCTETQYCSELLGGPAGSEPSYSCFPLGDCLDCACLEVVGCQCTENEGAIKVICAAP